MIEADQGKARMIEADQGKARIRSVQMFSTSPYELVFRDF